MASNNEWKYITFSDRPSFAAVTDCFSWFQFGAVASAAAVVAAVPPLLFLPITSFLKAAQTSLWPGFDALPNAVEWELSYRRSEGPSHHISHTRHAAAGARQGCGVASKGPTEPREVSHAGSSP